MGELKHTSQATPRTVELVVDGQPRTVPVNEDGQWTTAIENLAASGHMIVAKAGAVESEVFSFTTVAKPVTENFNVQTSIRLRRGETWTSPETQLLVRSHGDFVWVSRNSASAGYELLEFVLPKPSRNVQFVIRVGSGCLNTGQGSQAVFYEKEGQVGQVHVVSLVLQRGTYTKGYNGDKPITSFTTIIGNQTPPYLFHRSVDRIDHMDP